MLHEKVWRGPVATSTAGPQPRGCMESEAMLTIHCHVPSPNLTTMPIYPTQASLPREAVLGSI